MGGGRLSSLNAFRSTLIALDLKLEDCWSNCVKLENWPRPMRERSQALEVATQSNIVSSSSSLFEYSGLQHNFSLGMHPSLDENNLRGSRLITRLRFGALWLMHMERIASVLKLPDDQGRCLLCWKKQACLLLLLVRKIPVA